MKCIKCGKTISKNSKVCKWCNSTQKNKKKIITMVLTLIIIFILLGTATICYFTIDFLNAKEIMTKIKLNDDSIPSLYSVIGRKNIRSYSKSFDSNEVIITYDKKNITEKELDKYFTRLESLDFNSNNRLAEVNFTKISYVTNRKLNVNLTIERNRYKFKYESLLIKTTGDDEIQNIQTKVNPLLDENEVVDENTKKEIEIIDFDKYKELYSSNKLTTILLIRNVCEWCDYVKPILEHVAYIYDLDVKYLDISKLSDEQYIELLGQSKDLLGTNAPVFIYVRNNKIIAVDEGAKGTDDLVSMFRNRKVIR